jgi:D-hexose-6-phosphate mutarotase
MENPSKTECEHNAVYMKDEEGYRKLVCLECGRVTESRQIKYYANVVHFVAGEWEKDK